MGDLNFREEDTLRVRPPEAEAAPVTVVPPTPPPIADGGTCSSDEVGPSPVVAKGVAGLLSSTAPPGEVEDSPPTFRDCLPQNFPEAGGIVMRYVDITHRHHARKSAHTNTHTQIHTPIHTHIYVYICAHTHTHTKTQRHKRIHRQQTENESANTSHYPTPSSFTASTPPPNPTPQTEQETGQST